MSFKLWFCPLVLSTRLYLYEGRKCLWETKRHWVQSHVFVYQTELVLNLGSVLAVWLWVDHLATCSLFPGEGENLWHWCLFSASLEHGEQWFMVLNLPKCQARWHFSNQYLWGVKERGLSSVRSAFAMECDPVFQKQRKKKRWTKTSQRRAKHTSPGHRLRESSTAVVCQGRVCEMDLSRWFSYIIKDPFPRGPIHKLCLGVHTDFVLFCLFH